MSDSLLQVLQRLLERTYRMNTGVREIGRFVIGDEGFRRYYGEGGSLAGRAPAVREARRALRAGRQKPERGAGGRVVALGAEGALAARVIVHDQPDAVGAHIYYPDALIATLERHPPTRGLHGGNIDAFFTFVEELDHFLCIAERARLGRPVSLLELELHANVTKFLVGALFLAGGGARGAGAILPTASRQWLLWQLFEKREFAEPEPDVQLRYCEAARFARRFIDRLEREASGVPRVALLRAFHDSSLQEKTTLLN